MALLFGLATFLVMLLCGAGLTLVWFWQEGDPGSWLSALLYLPCVVCFALFVAAGAVLLALKQLRRHGDTLV